MKRVGIVTAVVVSLAVVGFMGCAGGPERDPDAFFTVDFAGWGLQTRNAAPLGGQWADFLIRFPDEIHDIDFRAFSRVTIRANAFNADGEPLQGDDLMMVTVIYDMAGDIRGPEGGPGPNTPLKEFNVGGSMGTVHTRRGTPLRLNRAPEGVLFQNSNAIVRYIEVVEITFHNR